MLIEWRDTLLVGCEPIDRDHHRLVSLINALYDDIKAGSRRETIDNALFDLADEVAAHFNHENTLMLSHEYPDRANHLLEHRKLIERLDSVLDNVDLLDDAMLLDAVAFMDRWFIDHVTGSDTQLGAFMSTRAAPTRPA